jgi:hypothetical protein
MIICKTPPAAGWFAAIFVGTLLGVSEASASPLSPGATIQLRLASEPDDARLVAHTNFSFTSGSFSGTLTSKVWADDDSNPWGGLTFTYKLFNASSCLESLGLFALRGFADSLVDVNYSGSGIAPRTVSRSVSGSEIAFGFLTRHGAETLLSGDTSAWLVIQTSCNTWGVNQLVGMDAEMVAATTFAPVAVPEPAAVTLLGLAFAAPLALRKRQRA